MKKTIFILFFAIIFVQNMFAYGKAGRDVAKQPSATPTFYLGDVATFAWAISSGPTLVKIGVGILASSPTAYTNLTWNTPTNYTYTGYSGKMYNYTVTSVGTGYYSIWLGWGAAVGTNGSFFNGKNTTYTLGDNNNSGSPAPWNSTYCYGTFTASALSNPTSYSAVATSTTQIDLSWTKETTAQTHNVIIVRQTSNSSWTTPTQGTPYALGATLGSGTVVYSGTGSSYSDASLVPATTYYYKCYSLNNNYYSDGVLASATTSGSTATDYFRSQTTGNWSNTATWQSSSDNTNWITATLVPNVSAKAITILSGNTVTIDQNASANLLTINSGATLTINAGKQLTVNSTLSNSGTLNLLSDATGTATILTPSTISGSGIANVNQHLTYRTWYMSSPVASATPSGMNIIKSYSEATHTWSDHTPTMLATIGYQVVPAAAANDIAFTGTLNSGNQSIALTSRTGVADKAGFNLVGNPYPAYLNWDLVTANSTNLNYMRSSTLWYRTKLDGAYSFWTVNGDGIGVPNMASKYIPPMQAFWVRAVEGGGSLALTSDMTTHAPATDKLLKAPAASQSALQILRLQVSNGTNTDEAVIYFSANASNDMDKIDAPKMSNENATIPEIYTTLGTERIVINAMHSIPLDQPIGLGFVPGSAASFSIKANEVSNLPADVKVILKDNVTLAETDLTDGTAVYQFSPEATSADRFSVIFRSSSTTTGLNNNNVNGSSVYWINNQGLTFRTNDDKLVGGNISVYNAIGQKLLSKKITGTSMNIDFNYTPDVYIVKVNNVTAKVIVK